MARSEVLRKLLDEYSDAVEWLQRATIRRASVERELEAFMRGLDDDEAPSRRQVTMSEPKVIGEWDMIEYFGELRAKSLWQDDAEWEFESRAKKDGGVSVRVDLDSPAYAAGIRVPAAVLAELLRRLGWTVIEPGANNGR